MARDASTRVPPPVTWPPPEDCWTTKDLARRHTLLRQARQGNLGALVVLFAIWRVRLPMVEQAHGWTATLEALAAGTTARLMPLDRATAR